MNDEIILLTPAQVSDLLGLGLRTVERLVEVGRLPAPLKLGRASRWRRDVLVAALAHPPEDDTPADALSEPVEGVVRDEKSVI